LKGGHSEADNANDVLFYQQDSFLFESPRINKGEKHGSGCVLSAAIASGLAKGLTLPEACSQAKTYINHFLSSSPTLLGSHY
jgi:hydroxymethylpyrimidine/phosphomethylpyrimidine kinase